MERLSTNTGSQVTSDVTCTVCACLCDDLRMTSQAGRVVHAEGACGLAEPWFLRQGTAQPSVVEVDGTLVSLSEGIRRAAQFLNAAKAPLIYGLSRSGTEGQRAAVRLADF